MLTSTLLANHMFVESGDIKRGKETKNEIAIRKIEIVIKMGIEETKTENDPGKHCFERKKEAASKTLQ